jgi:pyruvate dehydrogenase E1 component alpha subunit
MSKEYKFFASSIVGGSIPIAVGVALAIKRQGLNERVFCFLGDMCGFSGIFHECQQYSRNFDLPITFIIENNNLSTNSPTNNTWGLLHTPFEGIKVWDAWNHGKVLIYCYERQCPHINVSEWVEFR